MASTEPTVGGRALIKDDGLQEKRDASASGHFSGKAEQLGEHSQRPLGPQGRERPAPPRSRQALLCKRFIFLASLST